MERQVVIITGPTASGKSEIAFQLARKLDTEIISADSRQIFDILEIGTARPGPEKTGKVKYHLSGILDLNEPYNAAKFAERSKKILDELLVKGKIPIIEGGAGLYIRALVDGIIDVPGDITEIREELKAVLKEKGKEGLYSLLVQEDPESAETMLPQNWQRVLRALEVKRSTGKPIGWFHKNQQESTQFEFIQFGINRNRSDLYDRINHRVDEMIRNGLVDEVKKILNSGYSREINALNTVGYKEIIQFLDKEFDLEKAVELIKRNSRRYAKRQLTWFNADKRINWIALAPDSDYEKTAQIIYNKIHGTE